MDAKGALIRLALGTMMAATLWVGGPAMTVAAQEFGEWRTAEGSAATAPGTAPAGEESMQPVYQGTQQVVSFFGRELEAAMSQTIALVGNLARGKVGQADKFALAFRSKERYPVTISPLTHTVGFTKEEIQYLTKRGSWVTVRESGRGERVVLAAIHSPGNNAIVSVAIPLAKFTSSIDPFRVGQDGRLFVIDGAGNVLNNPGRRLNVDRDALLKMLGGDDLGTLETRSSIISFSKVPAADWYTMIEVPKAEARSGLVFPSDTQMRMGVQLEPPTEVVRVHNWSELAIPGLATLLLLGLGGAFAPMLLKRRRPRKNKGKPILGGDQPTFDLDNFDNPPEKPLLNLDRDKLGKASKNWASDELAIAEPKGDLASATRMKMVMRQQARDQERMLQQLQHSLELTISETRDQIHEVMNAHQGKIKALSTALEQTRNNLLYKADGEALAALVDDLKTKLFQAEADQRQASVGVEKRLSSLSRKVTEMESNLGKSVSDLQDKLSDDLIGRQESLGRAMESLETKTRESQRQVSHDAAAAKLSAAQAAEQAASLEAEFQELKTKASLDIEDTRRQAASDVGSVRAQIAQMDDLRAELKDCVARFQSSQIDWEENARTLSRRVNDEMASLQQRIFDREGDTEKLRILVDQAIGHVSKAREDFDIRRERLERDLDTLKGKLYLSEEEIERFKADALRRLEELAASSDGHAEHLAGLDGRLEDMHETLDGRIGMAHVQMDQQLGEMRQAIDGQGVKLDEASRAAAQERSRLLEDLERRFAAHVAETERRTSEAIAEALASSMAAVARVDAARADGEAALKAEVVSAFEKAEDVAGRAERARARLEDKLLDDQKALEDRLTAQQRLALDRFGELQAELQVGHDAFRNELQAGRERDDKRIEEFEEKIARIEVREAQERTRLEDQLKGDFQALHQDLAGRHLALREELVAAQEVFQADVRDEWLAGRQEDVDKAREEAAWARSQEAQTRESALDSIREVVGALGQEVRQQADSHRQSVAAELATYREHQTQHQAHLEQALGELARKVAADLGASKEREDSLTNRVSSVEAQVAVGLESLHTQLMQEAATAQEILRRLDSRLTELTESSALRFEDLAGKSEQLVASAIAALPDHPEVIGLHREVEQLHQDAYRGREDLEQLRELIERNMRELGEQHTEHYSKLASLVQLLLKLYQNSRETDERVSKVLSTQQHKVEGLHQEVLAIRSMVITKPGPLAAPPAGGAPMPLL